MGTYQILLIASPVGTRGLNNTESNRFGTSTNRTLLLSTLTTRPFIFKSNLIN